jgi:hypothetical protein
LALAWFLAICSLSQVERAVVVHPLVQTVVVAVGVLVVIAHRQRLPLLLILLTPLQSEVVELVAMFLEPQEVTPYLVL